MPPLGPVLANAVGARPSFHGLQAWGVAADLMALFPYGPATAPTGSDRAPTDHGQPVMSSWL